MKKNIAIVSGGYSGESVISYKTAQTAMEHIDKERFRLFLVDIRRDGWFVHTDVGEFAIDKNNFSCKLPTETIHFDFAYLALHGTPGEDGKLQGYFDMIGLKYNTGDSLNLGMTFNKKFTTSVLHSMGFLVAKSLLLRKGNADEQCTQIAEQLSFPLFVKPNNGGSSIGISKVYQEADLKQALALAYSQDDEIIVEEFIQGREFTCGVLPLGSEAKALPITEIKPHNDFFDYQAKYEGAALEITPAELSPEATQLIQETAERIYKALKCKGIVRIDFILAPNGPHVIEINTVPGMSAASIIPQQLRAAQYDLGKVLSEQILQYMD